MKKRVREILYEQLRPRRIKRHEDIVASHSIIDDLGADSLDMVEICMAIEEEFEIEITDEEYMGWQTVDDIYQTVEKYVKP